MESSGETPQRAAVNPCKLPQLLSLNPCGMRQFETTASTKFYSTRLTQWESVCLTSKKLAVRIHYRVLRTFSSAG